MLFWFRGFDMVHRNNKIVGFGSSKLQRKYKNTGDNL